MRMKPPNEQKGFVFEALIFIIVIIVLPFVAIPRFLDVAKCASVEPEKKVECLKSLDKSGN